MHLATSQAPSHFRSSAVRPGAIALIVTAIQETLSRRRLIRYLVRAEVKRQGTDTVLGNVWWLLDPLISMMIYVVVMTFIFQRSTPDFPLFLLAAMIPFKSLTSMVEGSTKAIVGKDQLIKQIQFPKIVLPIMACGAELLNLAAGGALLAVLLFLIYLPHASVMLLWIPVIVFVQFFFTLGIAIGLSAITVFYRDVGNLIGHVSRLLFYIAPILWSFDDAKGRGADLEKALGHTGFLILKYNPISILLESYRHVIYGIPGPDGWTPPIAPDLMVLGIILAVSIAVLIGATVLFKRLEPAFAKVL
jgi:lipopolysaccharide transport system permease protein